MDINQRIYDGDQARLVLENEVFQQVMDDIKTELTEQWKQSPVRDCEGREKIYQLLRLVEKLEVNLKTRLETGKLARMEVTHNQTLMDRAKQFAGLT